MQPLDAALCSQLEKTVKDAHDIAETGAEAALNRIGVGDKKKLDFLNDEQADLRVRLRARGRQLGDTLHNSDAQELTSTAIFWAISLDKDRPYGKTQKSGMKLLSASNRPR